MNRWSEVYLPWLVALLMLLVPTRGWVASASVATTTPHMNTVMQQGFSSARPYMGTILRETAGIQGVQLDKAMAMEGELFTFVVIPLANKGGSFSFRIDRAGVVTERTTIAITDDGKMLSTTVVVDGKATLAATAEKNGNAVVSGWVERDGQRTDLAGWTPPSKEELGACSWMDWFGCMLSCLSESGVPSGLLVLLGVVCTVACLGTAGLGCLLCVSGMLVVFSYQLGHCMYVCQRYQPF